MALIKWLIELEDVEMISHLENLALTGRIPSSELSQGISEGLNHALEQIEKGKVIAGEVVHARLKAKYQL